MNARELPGLELVRLAAEAAGHEDFSVWPSDPGAGEPHPYIQLRKGVYLRPLSNLGDALEMAIAMAELRPGMVTALSIGTGRSGCEFNFVDGPDMRANTCRAIVLAAAQLQLRREGRRS